MKKRELLEKIEALEKRVAELEGKGETSILEEYKKSLPADRFTVPHPLPGRPPWVVERRYYLYQQ